MINLFDMALKVNHVVAKVGHLQPIYLGLSRSSRLNLLTKTTWKLKTPGGILVFRLLVQVWLLPEPSHISPVQTF